MTIAVALVLGTLAVIAPFRMLTLGLATSAICVLALGVVLLLRRGAKSRKQASDLLVIRDFIKRDATPNIVTNADGRVRTANPAAAKRFDLKGNPTLSDALKTSFANPGGILHRLQSKAGENGSAQEDVFTRSGHVRVSVHALSADVLVWRVEQFAERGVAKGAQDSTQLPMVMVGRNDAILFMNEAARVLIGTRVKALDRLFTQMPIKSGEVTTLSTKEGSTKVLVAEVQAAAGRRALYLLTPSESAASTATGIAGAQGWQAFQDLPWH